MAAGEAAEEGAVDGRAGLAWADTEAMVAGGKKAEKAIRTGRRCICFWNRRDG